MKWGLRQEPSRAEKKGRALFFFKVRTALRTSATVSLLLVVSATREAAPPAYWTLVVSFMASRVTHSMTVPSCSPKSSAESAMTGS